MTFLLALLLPCRTPCSEGTGCSHGSEGGLGDGNGLSVLPYKYSFPKARGSKFQSCCLSTNSMSVEVDGFAQGLQSAPEHGNESSLAYVKVFWAPNIWCSWFMWPQCPCVDKTQPPFGTDHPAALLSIPSSREELCNSLIAVGL